MPFKKKTRLQIAPYPPQTHGSKVWTPDGVIPASKLNVPIEDYVFQHGLGAFETLRTWDGYPSLWLYHKKRFLKTVEELGIDWKEPCFPLPDNILELKEANGHDKDDAVFRITITSGNPAKKLTPLIWMTSSPLPTIPESLSLRVEFNWRVGAEDPLARYKSLNYLHRKLAFDTAQAVGCDDSILVDEKGHWLETSRMSWFLLDEDFSCHMTRGPSILDSVAREFVQKYIFSKNDICFSPGWKPSMVLEADHLLAMNAIRGIVPVREIRVNSRTRVKWEQPDIIGENYQAMWTLYMKVEKTRCIKSLKSARG